MYTSNSLIGFLGASIRVKDGEEKVFYNISSKQNMTRIFERKEMDFEDIKTLFFSWEKAVAEAERYLLNPSFILCMPEYIYYDITSAGPEWIFYPKDEEAPLPSGLVELAEFLLEKVNHKDTKAVDIAYRFYRSAKAETFLLPEMIKALNEASVQPRDLPSDEDEEFVPIVLTSEPEKEEEKEPDFLDFFGRLFRSKKPKERKGKEPKIKEKTVRKESNESVLPVWNSGGLDEPEYTKTRLIGEEGSSVQRVLKNCATKERYSLKNLPVVVGKLEGTVDICLDDDSISRLHARFFEQDGEVYLEDLNSTNGCSVNEIPLENNEKVRISPGDRILIGESEFIYN